MSNGAGKFSPFSQIKQVKLQRSLKKSEHSHERYRSKTQRFPRFLREYQGEVPGCPGGVGAYVCEQKQHISQEKQYINSGNLVSRTYAVMSRRKPKPNDKQQINCVLCVTLLYVSSSTQLFAFTETYFFGYSITHLTHYQSRLTKATVHQATQIWSPTMTEECQRACGK